MWHRSDFRAATVFIGDRDEVRRRAADLVGSEATWLAEGARREARRLLGQGRADLVWELAEGFDADVLGMVHGLVRAGGRLVILGGDWVPSWPGVAVWPHGVGGRRMEARLEHPFPSPEPIDADPFGDQAAVVATLRDGFEGAPSTHVLLADRGRGKSAALGMAIAGLQGWVTSPHPEAAAEVLRFAPDAVWLRPESVRDARILVIDEAAMFPLPVLEALLARNPSAHLVFATTVHGYEGTGRGFALRFLPRLRRQGAQVLTLTHPIRWPAGDPLEAWVYRVLALDAVAPTGVPEGYLVVEQVGSDRLAGDEQLLREVFGLLVEAHYRTTPSDLQRLLDAPNLRLFVARRGSVVGVNLVALEGGFGEPELERLRRGERFRGHALPDTLYSHAGSEVLPRLPLVRSVRIAVRQDCRRQGIASALVDAVHAAFPDAVFGTLFGAVPEVLRFRRRHGYHLVRVGVARGSRSGGPTAVMLRGSHPGIERLRRELARDAPVLLARLATAPIPITQDLRRALSDDLVEAPPWDEPALQARLRAFANGRPFEAVVPALVELERRGRLVVDPQVHALIQGTTTWEQLSGWPSIRAAMRGVRAHILDGVRPGA